MIFFIDNCLDSPEFTDPLEEAGISILKFRDSGFKHNELDEVWIPEVSSLGYIIVTTDGRIRVNYQEIKALILSNAWVLELKNGTKATHKLLGENFVATFEDIEKHIKKYDTPMLARLNRPSNPTKTKGSIRSQHKYIEDIKKKIEEEK